MYRKNMKNRNRSNKNRNRNEWILDRIRQEITSLRNQTYARTWESGINDYDKSQIKSNYSTASSYANKIKSSLYTNRRNNRKSFNYHSFNRTTEESTLMKELKLYETEKENLCNDLSKTKISTGVAENIHAKYTKKRKKPGCCALYSNKTFNMTSLSNETYSVKRESNIPKGKSLNRTKYCSIKLEDENNKTTIEKDNVSDSRCIKPFSNANKSNLSSRNLIYNQKGFKSKTFILAPPCTTKKDKNESNCDILDISIDMFSSEDCEYKDNDWQYREVTEERLGTLSEFDNNTQNENQALKLRNYCRETRFINSMKESKYGAFSSRRQSFLQSFLNQNESNIIIRNGREILKDVSNKRTDFSPNLTLENNKPINQICNNEETVHPETLLTTEHNCDISQNEKTTKIDNIKHYENKFRSLNIEFSSKRNKNTEYIKPTQGDMDATNNHIVSYSEIEQICESKNLKCMTNEHPVCKELEMTDSKCHVIFTIGQESKCNINNITFPYHDKENYPVMPLQINTVESKTERISTIEEPFKGFNQDTFNITDLNVKNDKNDELSKYLQTNLKSSSNLSSYSDKFCNSIKKNKKTTLFKTLDCNYIEPLYVNSDAFGCSEEESSDMGTEKDLHKAHLIQTLLGIQYVRTLNIENHTSNRCVILPPSKHFSSAESTKTIVFDLDETLIHCIDDLDIESPDIILPIKFPSGEEESAGINVRPYLKECLTEANKYFQVIVFTASHQAYADVVLDYLDPNNEFFQYRLYRESCTQICDGVYIKDLSIIKNRQLENLIIVDNAVLSFGFHLDNGIPILPFYDDHNDEELYHLSCYLNCIKF